MGHRSLLLAALAAVFVGAFGPPQVNGQVPTTAPAQTPPAEPADLPGPRFNALRFNDDFSYLDGEEGSYRPDFFDPIKNIGLGGDWRVSFVSALRTPSCGAVLTWHDGGGGATCPIGRGTGKVWLQSGNRAD